LRHTLEDEYAKPFLGEPFQINGYTTLQTVEAQEYNRLKKELGRINKPKIDG
jgi:penicillin-binding protein 2